LLNKLFDKLCIKEVFMNSMNGSQGVIGPTGKIGNKIPKGQKLGQIQQFTPEQMQLFQQLFSQVSPDSYLSRLAGGDQSLFEEMEAPAHRQFQEQIGGLASRFSQGAGGRGALGARRSSGFQNMATASSSNFAQDLASKRQELQRQAIMDLMGLSNDLLGQRPYESGLYEKQQKKSGWGGLAGAALGGLGGFFAGGPSGALTGSQLGYGIGSQF
jgi:hypothetical protein